MSTNVSSEVARATLRREHSVRLVSDVEEGSAADALPTGVYGFTASPILASPLFAVRRFRNFEVHRLSTGVNLIGFVTAAHALALTHPTGDTATVTIYPDAEGDATAIISIPYNRIVQHRQYSVRNLEAIAVQVITAQPLGV